MRKIEADKKLKRLINWFIFSFVICFSGLILKVDSMILIKLFEFFNINNLLNSMKIDIMIMIEIFSAFQMFVGSTLMFIITIKIRALKKISKSNLEKEE